jgi:hypothetical protein
MKLQALATQLFESRSEDEKAMAVSREMLKLGKENIKTLVSIKQNIQSILVYFLIYQQLCLRAPIEGQEGKLLRC